MEYPMHYHETETTTEYRVHGYVGIIGSYDNLTDARKHYHNELEETGMAMITKKVVQHITTELYDHVQGNI